MSLSCSTFSFEVLHTSSRSRARVGKIITPHGEIQTPGFVAVGTNGTLKALDNGMSSALGLELMFCNTYHLLLQPGTKVIKEAGGLHCFIGRKGPIITDSGGFQVFSLAYGSVASELKSAGKKQAKSLVLRISEEGVLFRSYRDGSKILLSPESSVAAQKDLGADIIIPFDELPPYHMPYEDLRISLERTHRWEKRSLEAHLQNPQDQAMYGVIHGGTYKELRTHSCQFLTSLDFAGYAIGGSLGKTKEEMEEMLTYTTPLLPLEKPIHLLGMGDLVSIDKGISLGIDTFDSSYPTRSARHATALTFHGPLNITHPQHKENTAPIDRDCTCSTCQQFSLSYLHHLFKAKELTAYTLATIHNLHFMMCYMERQREKILANQI